MSIVEFDGPPSWSLNVSETGERLKCPWVVAVGLIAWGWRSGKNRETVTASHGLTFAGKLLQQQQQLIGRRDNRVYQSGAEHWQLEWQKVTFITSRLRPKVASISREFSGECFDFDRLCVSCLGDWGLVAKGGCFSFTQRKRCFGGSCNSVWKEFNISKFCSSSWPSRLVIVVNCAAT